MVKMRHAAEIFEHCLLNKSVDYNDLNDELDDDKLLDSGVLCEMNYITKLCNEINDRLSL